MLIIDEIQEERKMKEYEIVSTYLNGCAGEAHPQTDFEEAELENTDDFVRAKHGKDFDKFEKEILDDNRVKYTYQGSAVCYIYEFTEI